VTTWRGSGRLMRIGCWISVPLAVHFFLSPAVLWVGDAVFCYHNDTTSVPMAVTDVGAMPSPRDFVRLSDSIQEDGVIEHEG